MIRISPLTAIEILSEQAVDINQVNSKMHCYFFSRQSGTSIDRQIMMDDNYVHIANTRRASTLPNRKNVLASVNFYPETVDDIANFHVNSNMQALLSDVTLPNVEMKNIRLYYGQGVLTDSNIVAHSVQVYCINGNDERVTLASFCDFRWSTLAKACTARYFESQVFNEALDFQILDVDFLFSSVNPEVIEIRNMIFGENSRRPEQYFIEYGVVTSDGVDEVVISGVDLTRISMVSVNQQTMLTNVGGDELQAKIAFTRDNYAISSQLRHERFEIDSFMSSQKDELDTYDITHSYVVESYNIEDSLISSTLTKIVADDFSPYVFRPIVSGESAYARVLCTIRVHNTATGLVIRRESSMIISVADIQKFKLEPEIQLISTEYTVNKIERKEVRRVSQSAETPKILQIEKRVYVQMQPVDTLNIYNATQVVEILLPDTVTVVDTLYCKIGDKLYETLQQSRAVFELDSAAYLTSSQKYLLVDSDKKIVAVGDIKRL